MRELNTPISSVIASKQYVSSGKYKLALNAVGGISMENSYYQYIVTNLPSGEQTPHVVFAQDFPPAFRAKLKELHQMVVAHAENEGIIQSGTDTDDL